MSIYCVGLCLTSHTGLKLTDKFILLALCEKADNDGTNAWPSVATLARYAECDDRTVQRSLKKLKQGGWITVTKRATSRRPTIYRVSLDRFQGCQIVTPEVTPETVRGDTAMSPDPSSTRPVQDEPDAVNGLEIHSFVQWWMDTYKDKMNGTPYVLRQARDLSIIKRMLGIYGLERMKLMAELFLVTNEAFIASTDRGIPLLSAKSMWLDNLLREHGR
jgi:hypothetical protein